MKEIMKKIFFNSLWYKFCIFYLIKKCCFMNNFIFIVLLIWTGTTINAQTSEEVQKERAG